MIPKRSARSTLSVPVNGGQPRSVVGRPYGVRRPGGPRGSDHTSAQALPSIGDFFSRFREWVDGRRFAALPGLAASRGRWRLSGINRKTSASAWRKSLHAVRALAGEMIALDCIFASSDMQIWRSACGLGYLSRFISVISSIRKDGDTPRCCALSLFWSRETRLICSRTRCVGIAKIPRDSSALLDLAEYVCRVAHNLNLQSLSYQTRWTVHRRSSWWSKFNPGRALAVLTPPFSS